MTAHYQARPIKRRRVEPLFGRLDLLEEYVGGEV
jgi:hypothetical protein